MGATTGGLPSLILNSCYGGRFKVLEGFLGFFGPLIGSLPPWITQKNLPPPGKIILYHSWLSRHRRKTGSKVSTWWAWLLTQCAFRFVDEHYIPTNSLVLTELREQLCASVRRHLLAEVPFGLLLSGGLDSSLVAAIACRENKRLGHGEVLKSFCIGLKGSPDLAAAEQVLFFISSLITILIILSWFCYHRSLGEIHLPGRGKVGKNMSAQSKTTVRSKRDFPLNCWTGKGSFVNVVYKNINKL